MWRVHNVLFLKPARGSHFTSAARPIRTSTQLTSTCTSPLQMWRRQCRRVNTCKRCFWRFVSTSGRYCSACTSRFRWRGSLLWRQIYPEHTSATCKPPSLHSSGVLFVLNDLCLAGWRLLLSRLRPLLTSSFIFDGRPKYCRITPRGCKSVCLLPIAEILSWCS